jgi:hypothetical protein
MYFCLGLAKFHMVTSIRYGDNEFQSLVYLHTKTVILNLVPTNNKRLCMGIFLHSTTHISAISLSADPKFSGSLYVD